MRKFRKYGAVSVVIAVLAMALLLVYGCKCQFVTEFKCDSTGKCTVTQKLVCSVDNVPPVGMLDPMAQIDMIRDLMIVNDTITMDFIIKTDRGIRLKESIPFKQYGKPLASKVIKNAKSYRLVPVSKANVQKFYVKVLKNSNKTFSGTIMTKAAYKPLVKTATLTPENIMLAGRLTRTAALVSSPITFK